LEKIMDGFGGRTRKFICKDCMDARQKKLEEKACTNPS
jgi:hypothetical protein